MTGAERFVGWLAIAGAVVVFAGWALFAVLMMWAG